MRTEPFLPERGFNDIFSLIKNFDNSQPPHQLEGFDVDTGCLVKRPGIFCKKDVDGSYIWQLDGAYKGHIIFGDKVYAWDNLCHVYVFQEGLVDYDLISVFDNTGSPYTHYNVDISGDFVKQKAMIVDYLSAYQSSGVVASGTTNDDGNGNVVLKTTTATFTALSVGSYIYFPVGAIEDFRYQIRQVIQYLSPTEVYLSEQLYWDEAGFPTLPVGQTFEIYGGVNTNIVFNNLKNIDGLVLTYDIEGNAFYARALGGKDICLFDGKYWILSTGQTSISGSLSTGEFEILDIDLVFGVKQSNIGERIVAMETYTNYIVVFYRTRISVIWTFAVDGNKAPMYTITNVYSKFSIEGSDQALVSGDSLYFVSKLKKDVYKLEFTADGNNKISGKPVSQGKRIRTLLKNNMLYSDRVFIFEDDEGIYVGVSKPDKTILFFYNMQREGRVVHESYKIFNQRHEGFLSETVMGCDNLICLRKGGDDLGLDIDQELVITGPKDAFGDTFTLQQVKIMLGYYNNVTDFNITSEIGGGIYRKEVDDDESGIKYVQIQNIAASSGALGTIPLGYPVLGANNMSNSISRMGLIGFRTGVSGVYYKFTIRNTDNKDLNILGIFVQIKAGNPANVPKYNVS